MSARPRTVLPVAALGLVAGATAQVPLGVPLALPAHLIRARSARLPKGPSIPSRTEAKRPKSLQAWLKEELVDRVQITGNRVIGMHSHQVDGDREAFNALTAFGQGDARFTNNGQMTVQGRRVLGLLDFEVAVTDNRLQDPNDRRTTVTYDKKGLLLSYGDVRGELTNTNPFARFNRTLNGAMMGYRLGRTQFRALRSQSRGSARTVSLEGNNSVGPYYLQSGRVMPDSIEIQVDGQPMKFGEDFVLDSDMGAITFLNRTIPPTSTIVATYEAQYFNEGAGTLQGAGLTYDFGAFGRVGLQTMEQRSGDGVRSGDLSEFFQGYGAPSQGYTLDYEPTPGTIVIRVGTVVQAPGADYNFDPKYPRTFYFTRFVDGSQTVTVTYRPVSVQTVTSDRRTWGADYRIPFGREGRTGGVQFSMARGENIGGQGGMARGVGGDVRFGDFRLRADLRDVPQEFVSVESRGFARNERSFSTGLDWAKGNYVAGTTYQNSSVAGATGDTRLTSGTAFLRYNDPGGFRWTLSQTRNVNRVVDETRLDTTSLSARRPLFGGRANLELGLDDQTGRGPQLTEAGRQIGSVGVRTLRSGLTYDLGGGLAANARASFSRVSSLGGDGDGRDTVLGVTYRPNERFSLSATRSDSNSGQIATLGGFSNGTGAGYGGNGFSGGAVGDVLAAGASSLRSSQLTADYRPSDRLSFTTRAYQTRSEGDLTANADTTGFGMGLNWDLGRFHNLSLTFDRSATAFVGDTNARSSANSYSLGFSAQPRGRFNYSFALTGLNSSGGLAFSQQNSLMYNADVAYRLNDRQRVTAGLSVGRTTGYYGQNDRFASLAYEYRLFGNVALRGIYRWRSVANVDPALLGGAYRSRGLDLELSFDFGR